MESNRQVSPLNQNPNVMNNIIAKQAAPPPASGLASVRPPPPQMPPPQAMPPRQQQMAPPSQNMPDPSMPTQEELNQLWAEQPTDQIGALIEGAIAKSGGALIPPWDLMDSRGQPIR